MSTWGTARRAIRRFATITGIRQYGLYIPYRYADTIEHIGVYSGIEPIFRAAESEFSGTLKIVDTFGSDLKFIASGKSSEYDPSFNQDWFPTLDAAVAYSLLRHRKPEKLVEIGSGHSTRFYARAIKDGELTTTLTTIDPAPRAPVAENDVVHIRSIVQKAEISIISSLAPGDILSIDSSHIMVPGSDVDVLFNNYIPLLPAGVIIHIHDIMLPDGYPSAWTDRGYNEQNAVAPLIQSGGFRLLFASHYVASRMSDSLQQSVVADLPIWGHGPAGSLWIEKL